VAPDRSSANPDKVLAADRRHLKALERLRPAVEAEERARRDYERASLRLREAMARAAESGISQSKIAQTFGFDRRRVSEYVRAGIRSRQVPS
jgi:DNA-binding CsgD family transcriptional regulator